MYRGAIATFPRSIRTSLQAGDAPSYEAFGNSATKGQGAVHASTWYRLGPPKYFLQAGRLRLAQATYRLTFNEPARLLRVVEIKPSGVAVLEGSDAARIKEHQKKIAHCPLPILDGKTYVERFYRGPTLPSL